MSRLKQLARESVLYGLSSIGARFLNFILVPFYTHVFTPEELGISTMLFLIMSFGNIVYQAGFDSAYLRLAHDAAEEERRRLFASAFKSQALLCLLFSALLYLLHPFLGRALEMPAPSRRLLAFLPLILTLDALSTVAFAHLRFAHEALRFALIRIASVVINVAANFIFLLGFDLGLAGVLGANVLASLGTLVLVSPLLLRNIGAAFEMPKARALLALGLPLMPAGLYGIFNEMAGRLFLVKLLDAEDLRRLYPGKDYTLYALQGIFSNAWKLGIFGLLLVQMYRMAWQPFFLQRRNDPDAPALFGRTLRYLLLFIGYTCIPLSLFIDRLVAFPLPGGRMLLDPRFHDGLGMVPLVLLAYAVQAVFIHFTLGPYIRKQNHQLLWCNGLGAVVTTVLSLVLIPPLGHYGAAFAALGCNASMALFMGWKSQGLFPIELPLRRFLPLGVWLVGGFAAALAFQAGPLAEGGRAALPLARIFCLVVFLVLPFLLGAVDRKEAKSLFALVRKRGRGPKSREAS